MRTPESRNIGLTRYNLGDVFLHRDAFRGSDSLERTVQVGYETAFDEN